jgi:hypothetical protein
MRRVSSENAVGQTEISLAEVYRSPLVLGRVPNELTAANGGSPGPKEIHATAVIISGVALDQAVS